MNLSSAIKQMRTELCFTQVEFANILHVTSGSVSRWELGKVAPTRMVTSLMVQYACNKNLSNNCVEALMQAVESQNKNRFKTQEKSKYLIDEDALTGIISEISAPVYVSDNETDEILYINKAIESVLRCTVEQALGEKCYKLLFGRETRCEFCRKRMLPESRFIAYDSFLPINGTQYRVEGKSIMWNGEKACVHIFIH